MHTKKYRASPLTDKKKSNSVRRRKKNIEQTENLPPPPPPHQKSNGPSLISVSQLFVLCIGLVFGGKYMEFQFIFSLQYSIDINTFEVDPPSDSLHNAVVKPKNMS